MMMVMMMLLLMMMIIITAEDDDAEDDDDAKDDDDDDDAEDDDDDCCSLVDGAGSLTFLKCQIYTNPKYYLKLDILVFHFCYSKITVQPSKIDGTQN